MQDATVQSTPQMSQAPAATVAPSSYVAQAPQAPAPTQAPAPQAYQVGTSYPQAVPQAAPSYQSSPTQYAPQSQPAAPEGNPWESAFNKVMNVLSTPVQSPFQGQPSQTETQYAPANYGQANSGLTTPASAPQTLSASQVSSANSSQTSSNLSAAELDAIQTQIGMSPESRQVMDAFGVEAPAVLNQYALNLEGMLDSAVQWGNQAQGLIKGYADFAVQEHQENLAYNEILTNPDVLSDYTLKYFGPEGPCPVYENEQELESKGYPTAPVAEGINTSATQPATNFPAPPEAAAPQQPENFWGTFTETMSRDPQNAWRMLNQAQPNTVQNKLFVME